MMRKFTALAAAFALFATVAAPSGAQAHERRDGYYNRHDDYYDHYYDRGRRHRDHDDDGDAVAAGVIGLVLGLALGAAASQPSEPRARCYDNYRRCEPPRGYYDQGYYYDPRAGYGPPPQAYYDPYSPQRPACFRRERQWDRYANRYVVVDVPC